MQRRQSVVESQRIKSYRKSRSVSTSSCVFLERDPCLRLATKSLQPKSGKSGTRLLQQLKKIPHIFLELGLFFIFKFFIPCIFYMCYNKNYQQMQLFVLCLYFLFLVFSLHVSGLHEPIIRGISSSCSYATIWFMQCFAVLC